MKLHLAISLTIGGNEPDPPDDLTVDLVGTLRDIPAATYDNRFVPNDDNRRNRP